jgi:hypothetical protein
MRPGGTQTPAPPYPPPLRSNSFFENVYGYPNEAQYPPARESESGSLYPKVHSYNPAGYQPRQSPESSMYPDVQSSPYPPVNAQENTSNPYIQGYPYNQVTEPVSPYYMQQSQAYPPLPSGNSRFHEDGGLGGQFGVPPHLQRTGGSLRGSFHIGSQSAPAQDFRSNSLGYDAYPRLSPGQISFSTCKISSSRDSLKTHGNWFSSTKFAIIWPSEPWMYLSHQMKDVGLWELGPKDFSTLHML